MNQSCINVLRALNIIIISINIKTEISSKPHENYSGWLKFNWRYLEAHNSGSIKTDPNETSNVCNVDQAAKFLVKRKFEKLSIALASTT